MNKAELRNIADYLYDGVPETARLMGMIQQFKDCDNVLRWLVSNKIRGTRMVEYFKDEAGGDDDSRGVMLGVQRALSFIDSNNLVTTKLTLGNLK